MSIEKKTKKKKKGINSKLTFRFWRDTANWKFIFLISVLTFAVFSPSLQNGFVNWDDDRNFLENKNIMDVRAENIGIQLGKIFTSGVIGNYNPIPIATFAFEKLFFGFENPMPWHLNNILLHIICSLLLFRLMLLLKVNHVVALGVTLLFAVHPLRVESVAWVTERKDVLFGAFYLGALINYVKYHRSKKERKYLIWVFVLFTLSLFSKIQAVTLPLSMLAIDYWRNRKIGWSLIIEKIPFFAMSLAMGIIGIFVLGQQGSLETSSTYSLFQRLFVGSYSYMVYLIKSLVPYETLPLYPYPETMPWYIYASMALVPLYLYGFYKAWINGNKAVVFGLAFFSFNIFFLLQILGAGQGFLADRFTYIAFIGLFFIIAYYFNYFSNKYSQYRNAFYGVGVVVILGYSFLSFQQNKIWKDSDTLWTHVLKYHRNITVAWGNRANYYRDNGQTQKALNDYSQVIELVPEKAAAYNSRGKLYFNSSARRDWPNALKDYKKALSIEPDNAEYMTNLGAIFAKMEDRSNALRYFSDAIKTNPNHAVAYLNRSIIYQLVNRPNDALSDIQTYLGFNPYNSDLWYEAGRLRRILGRPVEALVDFNKAIQYNANKGIYYYERSKAFYDSGNINNAKADLRNAQQRGYKGVAAYNDLLR
ncbi:MAG: tetratricopeptide repeat protein [Saprospiraceae bacterium]